MSSLQGAQMLTVAEGIPLITALIQGLLSFLSPCVLPLLPVYLSYLAGGGQTKDQYGETTWPKKTVLIHSLFFTLGISTTLVMLGMTFTAIGQFLHKWQTAIQMGSGILVVLFGLLQLGLIGKRSVFRWEFRLPLKLERLRMNPLAAFVMGLCFSFSWTPCIGPTLTGILMTAAAAATRGRGMILMTAYILGFILPFLALGLFTGTVLSFFRRHRGMVRWTGVVSGVLLMVMGVLLMTGTMSSWSSWLASASAEEDQTKSAESITAPDFTLTDQYGESHTLSAYQGKVVFMNLWTTWCPWCIKEMQDIEELYHELGENREEIVILGMASPNGADTADTPGIISFLEEHGWTYPVLMDEDGSVFRTYITEGYPTTWLIRQDGMIMGYISGALSKEQMLSLIRMTQEYNGE